ncbi:MAG TPA: hypothetical protein VKO45_07200 [Methanomicrobiales archaeon]|nr:hypothetical protein [Methanomicrobiales archaeon]
MEGLKSDGQWIIMMGFLVSLGIFFLAIIISQSTLVGQTTAEGVLEFPKNDLQDIRHVVFEVEKFNRTPSSPGYGNSTENLNQEIQLMSLYRKSAIVWYTISPPPPATCTPCPCTETKIRSVEIHYNNGVTMYDETASVPYETSNKC